MARRVGNIAPSGRGLRGRLHARPMLRYVLIATHYRAPLDWGDATLDNARAAVERLSTAVAALDAYAEERADDPTLDEALDAARDALHGRDGRRPERVRRTRRGVRSGARAQHARRRAHAVHGRRTARRCDGTARLRPVLGLIDRCHRHSPEGAQALLDERAAARARRDFAASDRLRDELAALGVAVEDTRDGQRWRLIGRATDG